MQRWREALALACRLGVGGVFVWAGAAKSLGRQDTILAVDAYRMLPRGLVTPVATALPWIEIAVGVFLLSGLFLRFAGVGSALLTLGFVVALAQAKARGLPIDCGCFGGGGPGDGVGWFDILRDLPVLFAGLFVAWRPGKWLQLDRLLAPEPTEVLTESVIEGGPA